MKMTPALARALEQVEAEAWCNLDHAATPEDVRANGISVATMDSASAMVAGRVDVFALSRVVGLGTGEPASDLGLDRIIRHYQECGAPSFHNLRRFGFEVACARPNYLHETVGLDGLS